MCVCWDWEGKQKLRNLEISAIKYSLPLQCRTIDKKQHFSLSIVAAHVWGFSAGLHSNSRISTCIKHTTGKHHGFPLISESIKHYCGSWEKLNKRCRDSSWQDVTCSQHSAQPQARGCSANCSPEERYATQGKSERQQQHTFGQNHGWGAKVTAVPIVLHNGKSRHIWYRSGKSLSLLNSCEKGGTLFVLCTIHSALHTFIVFVKLIP